MLILENSVSYFIFMALTYVSATQPGRKTERLIF